MDAKPKMSRRKFEAVAGILEKGGFRREADRRGRAPVFRRDDMCCTVGPRIACFYEAGLGLSGAKSFAVSDIEGIGRMVEIIAGASAGESGNEARGGIEQILPPGPGR